MVVSETTWWFRDSGLCVALLIICIWWEKEILVHTLFLKKNPTVGLARELWMSCPAVVYTPNGSPGKFWVLRLAHKGPIAEESVRFVIPSPGQQISAGALSSPSELGGKTQEVLQSSAQIIFVWHDWFQETCIKITCAGYF